MGADSERAALLQSMSRDGLIMQVGHVLGVSSMEAAKRVYAKLPDPHPQTKEEGSAAIDRICRELMGETA